MTLPTQTLVMLGAVLVLFVAYVILAEMHRRRSVLAAKLAAREETKQEVADRLVHLQEIVESSKVLIERRSTQLARCRETLRKVLKGIEVA